MGSVKKGPTGKESIPGARMEIGGLFPSQGCVPLNFPAAAEVPCPVVLSGLSH